VVRYAVWYGDMKSPHGCRVLLCYSRSLGMTLNTDLPEAFHEHRTREFGPSELSLPPEKNWNWDWRRCNFPLS